MTKEDLINLQKYTVNETHDKEDIIKRHRRTCELPLVKKVSGIMYSCGVSFDVVLDIAKECGIKHVESKDSELSVVNYNKIKDTCFKKMGFYEELGTIFRKNRKN